MSNILMCGTNPIGQVSDMTASNISYNNTSSGLTASDVQDAIYELNFNKFSMGGGTLNGNVIINTSNATTTEAFSQLTLGNNIAVGTEGNSTGLIRTYANTGYCVEMRARGDLSADQHLYIPNKSGDIAIAQEYKRQENVTPTNDYPTLLSYINNYVYPTIGNQVYSFPCSGFPDLPVTNWGFDVTVHIAGSIFVTIHKQLSNNEDYIREVGANSQWITDWKQINTNRIYAGTLRLNYYSYLYCMNSVAIPNNTFIGCSCVIGSIHTAARYSIMYDLETAASVRFRASIDGTDQFQSGDYIDISYVIICS